MGLILNKLSSPLFLSNWSIFLLLVSLTSCSEIDKNKKLDQRPNIILIVADDLGYADLSSYGGDIETPNIDMLATNGLRFSSYHTAPSCAPTRAMLLSGNDNHIAGMGKQDLITDTFGYEGQLSSRIATIPQVLRASGYHTYMAGKWHLGKTKESNPFQKGFEHSFVLLGGAGNHYNDQGIIKGDPISQYTEDGKAIKWNNGDYSTDFYTDKLIGYIDRHKEDKKPFFAFGAYTAPHWPLQVDEKYWKKYEGRYSDGYDKLKQRRLESLKKAGMIPENTVLPKNNKSIKYWNSLTEKEKLIESRKMELYAGMVDNLDFNIGRLIKHLKDIKEYENTIIVFMSDNGAAGNDFYNSNRFGPFLKKHFNNDYENMGNPNSFISYGPQWAEAGSSPFRYYKGFTTEGGMTAAMIISGPNVTRKNEIYHGLATVMDIAPTFYEVANTQYPNVFEGQKLYPMRGSSIMPLATGITDDLHKPDYVFGLEHSNFGMIRKGKWKITNIKRPFLLENFELFDLSKDLGEQINLKELEPDKYKELLKEWKKFSDEIKVEFPTPK
jgi:arylsulfatase A-like enzyme